MCLIGLDVGTTGCKALAFDEGGARLAEAYREYGRRGAGLHELDPEEVWLQVRAVLSAVASACPGVRFRALAVSSFGESFVPVDGDGRVLHNSLLYTDPRGLAQCGELKARLGEGRIMAACGVKPHPMYSACKIAWYRDALPAVFERTARFLLFEDFVLWRLGAEPSIDASLASRTMAFNVSSLAWEGDVLAACGIDESRLSKVVPSGTAVGALSPGLAGELGLGAGMLLVTGGHDQVCAAVGAGAVEPGQAIDGTGTVECVAPVFGRPVLDRAFLENNFACVPHAVPGLYTTYAFNFTGGSLLRWYRDHFAPAEAARAAAGGGSAYDILNGLAPAEPTGLLVIPHFAGSGTPEMRPGARGAILGLDFSADGPTLYRAMMEGVTYEMAYNLECLEEAGIPVRSLRAIGGGARSGMWLQIKADVTGRPIEAPDVEEAGAAGAAALAGCAAGLYGSVREALDGFVRIRRVFEPDGRNAARYAALYARYKEARRRVAGLFDEE